MDAKTGHPALIGHSPYTSRWGVLLLPLHHMKRDWIGKEKRWSWKMRTLGFIRAPERMCRAGSDG